MAEIFVVNGICGGTVFFLPDTPATLGRGASCNIQIGDPWISTTHARIERRGTDHWLLDLGSRNGTFLNDARVQEVKLSPGARLRFGKTAAEYRASPPVSSVAQEVLKSQGTLFRPLASLQEEVTQARSKATQRTTLNEGDNSAALAVARRQVAVLNEIGKALVDAPTLDACLGKILATVAAAARAERSCLLLMGDDGRMEVRATEPAGSPPRLSQSLIDAAKEGRGGLVTMDAQQDLRFAQSRSIVAQGIRSCLCSPIWADNRILGMLVMDRGFVEPFTADELELVTVVGYQAALAIERARVLERAREVEEQRKKLLRHFSPDVASMILSVEQLDRDPLEVNVRDEVTVLFSDVQGFTGLTERLPALELGALLKDYFQTMTDALFAEGGTLDKFIGDGLMAVFGAPVPQADGAVRALRCGLGMLERLKSLNARLPEDRKINIRIGINTGRVIAGNFGSTDRLEFTVLGDTVNIAARLESIALPGSVFVGQSTYERARHAFDFEALGARQLKGKAAAVEVFRLVGPRASS